MTYNVKRTGKELSQRKLEIYDKYCKIIIWGRRCPVKFCERFYGIELLDHQKYVFMMSWIAARSVWCFSRGAGKTTLASPFIMAKSNLFNNHQTYIMAGVGSQAQECFLKIESIAKKEIASFLGLTDFFLGEVDNSVSTSDGFVHDPASFRYKLFNGSKVNSLNGNPDNNRSKRSNLNFYDESGWIPDSLFNVSMPFITQERDFGIGGDFDVTLLPKKIPNQAIFASSASDTGTYFYRKAYKEYAKRMFMGDNNYFVADVDANVVFNARLNGKIFPVSLLGRQEIEDQMRKDRDIALREYFNKFTIDGGDCQPFKQMLINKNCELRLPELHGDGNKTYVMAYDPAHLKDNPIIMVAELINDEKIGYKMNICNAICLRDWATKHKVPLREVEQIACLRELLLDYNGASKIDYENVEMILMDAGTGGGAAGIASNLLESWTDKSGNSHCGIIDKKYSEDYAHRFPNAKEIIQLINPTGNKTKMFDALLSMLKLELISFTSFYDNKGYIMQFDDSEISEYENEEGELVKGVNRRVYKHELTKDEELALVNIDLSKYELINMYRYPKDGGKYSYDLAPAKKGGFDDRAYCLAMLGWYLQQKRIGEIVNNSKKKNHKIDILFKKGSVYGKNRSSFF